MTYLSSKYLIFCRYNFGKHTYDENLQYITSLSELERKRVDKWINEMKTLSQQSNKQYEPFDEARFRPLIGIDTVRDFIQDMWVKVSDQKKVFIFNTATFETPYRLLKE
jgi:hypothetical protein